MDALRRLLEGLLGHHGERTWRHTWYTVYRSYNTTVSAHSVSLEAHLIYIERLWSAIVSGRGSWPMSPCRGHVHAWRR